jgi:hypothetical protein
MPVRSEFRIPHSVFTICSYSYHKASESHGRSDGPVLGSN